MNAEPCVDHLHFAGAKCEDCGEAVDLYGNTENQFDYCCFPDCGCDGARLCMAKNGASDNAGKYNVENMYSLHDARPRLRFIGAIYSGELDPPASAMSAGTAETAQQAQGQRPASAVAEGETPTPSPSHPGAPDNG